MGGFPRLGESGRGGVPQPVVRLNLKNPDFGPQVFKVGPTTSVDQKIVEPILEREGAKVSAVFWLVNFVQSRRFNTVFTTLRANYLILRVSAKIFDFLAEWTKEQLN